MQRVEADLTSTWAYDTAPKGIGKLATTATNTGYSRSHAYDGLGRPVQTQVTIGTGTYAFNTSYDAASRVSTVTYPSGLSVGYTRNALSFQTQLTNRATNQVYWTAVARDVQMRLTQQVSEQTVYIWKRRLGTFEANDVRRLKALELENGRLKKLVAERDLEIEVTKEIAAEKW